MDILLNITTSCHKRQVLAGTTFRIIYYSIKPNNSIGLGTLSDWYIDCIYFIKPEEPVVTSSINHNLPRGNDIYAMHFSNTAPVQKSDFKLFGEDGFTFGDLIDIVNPLQHIPIVNKIYQRMTGDTIAPAMQVAGGALFGGPFGALASLATLAIESALSNDDIDPEVNPSGIDPATVAGTYPFQETPIEQEQHALIDPQLVKPGRYNGDGIFNPAASPNNNIAKANIQTNKELYASVNSPKNNPVSVKNSALINDMYKTNEPLIDLEQREHTVMVRL